MKARHLIIPASKRMIRLVQPTKLYLNMIYRSFKAEKEMPLVHIRNRDLIERYNNIDADKETAGNTPLHQLLCSSAGIDELEAFIDMHGEDSVIEMTKVINDQGDLPIDYVKDADVSLKTRISSLTLKPNTIKSSIVHEDIEDEDARKTLALSEQVVDEIRQLNIQSSTHPEMDYNSAAFFKASSRVKRLRGTVGRLIRLTEYLPEDWQGLKSIFIKLEASAVKAFNAGNCHELCYVALNRLRELDPSHNAELFLVQNGNHVFIVLDRNPESDANDYRTWGQKAVVVDPFSNTAFPANLLEDELKTNEKHTTYHLRPAACGSKLTLMMNISTYKRHNVETSYNRRHHKLRPILRLWAKDTTNPQGEGQIKQEKMEKPSHICS